MLKFSAVIIMALLLFSCGQKKQQGQQPTFSDSTGVDTVAILNDPKYNLNIQTNSFSEIDSSGIIMFPLSMGETSRDGGSFSYKEIPYSSYWNIIFYNSNNSQYHLLSDRKSLLAALTSSIVAATLLTLLFKTQYFYKVTVDDYNQDKKLTSDDPEYLFVSDKEGNNFRQISPKDYSLKSWQFIKSTNKIIMAVTKDSDKNRKFGDKDEVTTFQIDIEKEAQPTEIFSTEFKNKLKVLFDRDWKRIKE
ncbi:MAG: hypothetical protein IPQ25_10625 [Chitinophagaceae bacterium]|nr:hypothetical protein [Chitinophagaceae bacterium]